jgi:hypothetical protein
MFATTKTKGSGSAWFNIRPAVKRLKYKTTSNVISEYNTVLRRAATRVFSRSSKIGGAKNWRSLFIILGLFLAMDGLPRFS